MRPPQPLLLALLLTLLLAGWATPADAAPTARWHTFTAANGLAGNIVQAIWEDPTGRVWFGTENGVSRYDGRRWASFTEGDGLADSNVWAISGDGASVWFATSRGLSRLHDGQWRSYGRSDGLPGEDVRAVLVAADGTVWAGTFGRGIARLRPQTERWEAVSLPGQQGREGTFVQAIWQSPADDLWFATNGLGALRLRDGAFERVSFRLGNRNTVWSVSTIPGATDIYLGTFLGLARLGPDDIVTIFDEVVEGVPLASAEILAVAGDRRGDLWLGTRSQGVLHRGPEGWTRITAPGTLGRNYVQTILADRSGRVWFGTRGGGVSLLDPHPLPTTALRPTIEAETIPDGAVLAIAGMTLPARSNDLRFRFTLPLNWLPPDAVRVRYQLTRAGADTPEPWLETAAPPDGPMRAVTAPFVDLAPGHYTLRVVAAVAGSAGAEAVLQFAISSAPPALASPALSVEGEIVETGLSLTQRFLAGTRAVDVRFAASDDVDAPEALRYEYRLAPEQPWQPAPGGRARLTLASGVWQLEGRAVDADGNPSRPLALRVVVPPPLWPTVLLALAVVLVPSVASGVAGALLYRRVSRRQALRRAVRGYHIPYDVGPLITGPDRYIGRGALIDTVVGKIAQNNFYIYGEKRIGKTSLLLQVRDRLARRGELDPARALLPVFRNIQDVPQADFWLHLMRSVAGAVEADKAMGLACLGQPVGYDDLDAEDDLDQIVNVLGGATAPLIVLLLDEIDTLERYDPAVRQRFRAFCQHAQPHLRVIVAGVRPPTAEPGDTSPWYNIFERVALGPLSEAAARQLIRRYNQNPYAYAVEAENRILEASASKPFDLQWLCSEAVRAMLAEQRTLVQTDDAERAVRAVVAARAEEYAASWRLLSADEQTILRTGTVTLAPALAARLLSEGLIAPVTGGGYRAIGLWRIWLTEQASL